MAEQAANATGSDCLVCMGPRPLLKIMPAPINETCLLNVMTQTTPTKCTLFNTIFPVVPDTSIVKKPKPIFDRNVARNNYTCVIMQGQTNLTANVPYDWCAHNITINTTAVKTVLRADVYWWCGHIAIYGYLPQRKSGLCAIVSLIIPAQVITTSPEDVVGALSPYRYPSARRKRDLSWQSEQDPSYIDAIGVLRGVPNEYKLADQIAAGFESTICWWCTINKNVDRINYITTSKD